jgi:hypothetical protein
MTDNYIADRMAQLHRKARGHETPLEPTGHDGRRRTCRYVTAPYDKRCTGIPVGSLDAEVELCLSHLRLALELVTAENITL